MSVLTNTLKSS